jgi:serine protease Do
MKSATNARGKQWLLILGTVAMAFAAGLAGAAMIADYVSGSLAVSSGTVTVPVRSAAKIDATKVSSSARAAVIFYKKHSGTAVLDKVFLPADAVGGGLVLTADGWLVSSSTVLAGRDPLVVVFSDKTTVTVDPTQAVNDPATGVAYIKCAAQHLTVAIFGDDTTLQPADPVFSVSDNAIVSATVLAPRQLPIVTRTDYVETSEKMGRRIIMSRSGLVGSMVVDAGGNAVGLDMGDGTAVPETFAVGVLRDLFKDGKIVRPHVGVRFVSLDNLPNAHDAGLNASGALVTGDGKFRAVEKGSPAEVAGLREGDVITLMERDRINDEETLSERLQDYAPGATVELTVVRAGSSIKIPLVIK